MNIKVYSKSGKSKVLHTNSYAFVAKIAYRFEKWEYVKCKS